MKRLALSLAALVVGSGCIVSDTHPVACDRNVTVEWPQFLAADGTTYPSTVDGCARAAIVAVDVFLDDALVDRFACSDGGVTITGVPSGSHTITVEGIEAGSRIAFRDDFVDSATTCGDRLVQAEPAEGFLDLQYSFGGGTCIGTVANPSYIWFSVYDQLAGQVTAEVGPASHLSDQPRYKCGSPPVRPVLPLPAGPYTVRWVEETVLNQDGQTFTVTARNCAPTPTSTSVTGATTTPFPVALADSNVACL